MAAYLTTRTFRSRLEMNRRSVYNPEASADVASLGSSTPRETPNHSAFKG